MVKIGGRTLCADPYKDVIVFPRGDIEDAISIWAVALDEQWDVFNESHKPPKMPRKIEAGKGEVDDPQSPNYQKDLEAFIDMKLNYCVVQSITEINDIEWDNIDMGDPQSYTRWRKELRSTGLTLVEINKLYDHCMVVNSLNDVLLQRAKADFLSSLSLKEAAESGE